MEYYSIDKINREKMDRLALDIMTEFKREENNNKIVVDIN
jgi:hypothetical protein